MLKTHKGLRLLAYFGAWFGLWIGSAVALTIATALLIPDHSVRTMVSLVVGVVIGFAITMPLLNRYDRKYR